MGAGVWVCLTAVGIAMMLSKQLAGASFITWCLVRLSALFLLAAGVVGAAGWIGRWTNDLITWAISTATNAGDAALGTGVVLGVVVAIGSVAWLLALLPDSWWGGQMPDWGSACGLILPSLAVSIPGPIGRTLREDVFPALTSPLIDWVRSWFGM